MAGWDNTPRYEAQNRSSIYQASVWSGFTPELFERHAKHVLRQALGSLSRTTHDPRVLLTTLPLVPLGLSATALGLVGLGSAVVSAILGLGFCVLAWRFYKQRDDRSARQVFLASITYLPIVDGTVRLANLKSGALDLIERVLATDIKAVREDKKLKLIKAVSLGYVGLTVNLANGDKANNPLGKDPKVRRALELAIDREALNQVVFNGEFVPGNQWVSPQNPYYQSAMPVPKRDVAKAKALLKEAGVTGPLAIDFMVPNGAEFRQVAEVLQSMVAEAGFDLKIRLTEFATSLKQAEDGNFQLFLIGWSGRSDPDGNSFVFHLCNAPQNNGKYCDPEVDAAHKLARSKSDPAERKKAYETITRRQLADGSIIYLYHPQVLVALSDKVEGYKQMPDGLVRVVGLKLAK